MVEFGGQIGRDWRDSTPWWPPVACASGPNVVLVVLDDVGYAQLGCYGSDIETPVIDFLAHDGVRLANFHTTALCSPTRACLLTGRNHHRSAMGRVADLAIGFPGYWGRPPRENGYLSEVLRDAGYATYAVGKWHLTPEDETHAAAPRDTWPLSRGFDRWYGFHGGETHQFAPALYRDSHPVRPDGRDGYHLSEDLVDEAIANVRDLRAVDAERPFFLYLAFGACHSPHQPPPRWRDHYAGRFDAGWDAWRETSHARQLASGLLPPGTRLSPRPPWVPAWDSLDDAERRVAARLMECFAGFLSHADEQLGRLLGALEELGDASNTLTVVVSDNGASSEGGAEGSINDMRLTNLDPASTTEMDQRLAEIGGPTTHNNYPWGWTMAGNTPFRRWKREVHEGGVADPCVVHWPGAALDAGSMRHQFAHAIDVAPTILELCAVDAPGSIEGVAQSRLDGVSFAYLLGAGGDGAPERHETQYFEMLGSRGIYHRGWKAVTYHPVGPLYDDQDPNAPFDDDRWELYRVADDLSETNDLADAEPERLAELIELWWREAEANQVLPLDNRPLWALVHRKPSVVGARERYRYFPGASMVPESVAVNVRNRVHVVTVDVEVDDAGDCDGVLIAMGSVLGGWSLHVLDGRPRYVHNLYGARRDVVAATDRLVAGRHRVTLAYAPTGLGGVATLSVDGRVAATADIERFTPTGFSGTGVGLTCGYEWGPAVGDGYVAPFESRARIVEAVVEVSGPPVRDPLAELEAILSEQ